MSNATKLLETARVLLKEASRAVKATEARRFAAESERMCAATRAEFKARGSIRQIEELTKERDSYKAELLRFRAMLPSSATIQMPSAKEIVDEVIAMLDSRGRVASIAERLVRAQNNKDEFTKALTDLLAEVSD